MPNMGMNEANTTLVPKVNIVGLLMYRVTGTSSRLGLLPAEVFLAQDG